MKLPPRLKRNVRVVLHGLGDLGPDRPPGEYDVRARIGWPDPNAVPVPRPKSSRTIAAERAKADEAARVAEAAKALRSQVMTGLKPPSGKLFGVDVAGLLIVGPAGAIGSTPIVVRTLQVLAQGGRHPVETLVGAGWRDEAHLREGLDGIGPKLAAIGLRVDWRKAGARIAKARLPAGGAVS